MNIGFIGSGIGAVAHRFPSPLRCCKRPLITVPSMSEKMLHAVIRVGDLEGTDKFYSCLGMKVLRKRDVPSEKYTNVFYGYGPEQKGEHFSLELTYNYGVDSYDVGDGFNHFGVAVNSVAETIEKVRAAGFKVTEEAAPAEDGTMVGLVEDPTGYQYELMQESPLRRDPLCQVCVNVTDLEKSITFYEAMGMKVLRKIVKSKPSCTLVLMGFDDEADNAVVELRCKHGAESYNAGNGYAQIAVSTPDVYKAAERFEKLGVELARKPGPVPGIGTKICAVRDPDGWKTVLVDAEDFEKEFE